MLNNMNLAPGQIREFQDKIWSFYNENARNDLLWRRTYDPYHILVSEIMLQQTQVARVVKKYQEWLQLFPTLEELTRSELREVLTLWQGLGYNRRAKYLHQTAHIITQECNGMFPKNKDRLLSLPGIGPYTAGAVRAFAWNEPEVMIETNIRSVFIYEFFNDQDEVHDNQILPLVEKTLPTNAREWYWALMDYGAHLKSLKKVNNTRSKHYTRQSRFRGSNREQRSIILKHILDNSEATIKSLLNLENIKRDALRQNLNAMKSQGLLQQQHDCYIIADGTKK